MKKQILILVVFLLAAFAGVNKSYGQGTPQAPIPGTAYNYIVTGTPAGGTYTWSIIDAAVTTNVLSGASAAATYFTGTATAGDYAVTWTPAAVGKTFYVVSKYSTTAAAPASCTVMNMKVFEVKPVNTFILTMTLANSDGTTNAVSDVCPPAIVSADVSGTDVKIDYGVTTLYYNVKAEGLTGVWKPTVRIPALGATQVYTDVAWAVNTTTPTFATMTGFTASSGATQDLGLGTDPAVTIGGSNYLIKVVIANRAFETTTAQTISLEVDGLLGTDYTISDIIGGGNNALAGALGTATVKKAAYSITARPALSTALTPGFMPIIP